MTKLRQLEEMLCNFAEELGLDWSIKFTVAWECMWDCELRIAPKPNQHDGPDVSTVFLLAAGNDPEELAAKIFGRIRLFLVSLRRDRQPKKLRPQELKPIPLAS